MDNFNCILEKYGSQVKNIARKVENSNTKMVNAVLSIKFLKQCKCKNVIPRFLTLKSGSSSTKSDSILFRASKCLISDNIRENYRKKFLNLKTISECLSQLTNILYKEDLERFCGFMLHSTHCIQE